MFGVGGGFLMTPTFLKTNAQDAPELLARLREDGADAAILCAI